MKLKKGVPLIDQHDQFGFWGGKFGGSFIPETLKKPVEDLTEEFKKLRKNKKFKIDKNELAAKALSVMNGKKITSLIVHGKQKPTMTIGVIHVHAILQSNIS